MSEWKHDFTKYICCAFLPLLFLTFLFFIKSAVFFIVDVVVAHFNAQKELNLQISEKLKTEPKTNIMLPSESDRLPTRLDRNIQGTEYIYNK